jgi:hypothetical protein
MSFWDHLEELRRVILSSLAAIVVAAIAILGVILVGVVLAKSRHTHQVALAERKHAAVRAADALIAEWWKSVDGVPVGKAGAVESDASLVWETRVVRNPPLERLGARVVRVEVHEAEAGPSRSQEAPEAGEVPEPLVAVDLVLPESDDETPEEAGRE